MQLPSSQKKLIKNLANPLWRLNNLYSIVNKDGECIPFRENSIQAILNRCPEKRKLALKARQFGVSTNEILKALDFTIWNENVTTLILAHEQDAIKKLFRIVARAYKFLPDEFKPKLDRGGGSKYEYYFPEINSRIYVDLESRGDTIQWLHVSEAAFFKDWGKIASTLETVPLSGRVFLETTPNGMNEFYDEWIDPDSIYKKHFFPWFLFDEYQIPFDGKMQYTPNEIDLIQKAQQKYGIKLSQSQINFRRFKQKNKLFIQEYPEDDQSCFLSSGQSPLDRVKVKELLEKAPKPIFDDGTLKVWKHYETDRRYAIGADTAEGFNGDYSVAVVYDILSREQVAVLRGHFQPHEFAHMLDKLGHTYYKGGRPFPIMAVERNNHGHAVLLELGENIRYPNLYKTKDNKIGWLTDRVTRPIMIDTFIEALINESVIINDDTTLLECLTLINKNGKIEADAGKHDDCVIASCIGLQMCINRNLDIYKNISDHILL